MSQLIARISTMKLVKVLAVNPTAPGRGTVDVQPMVNQIDGDNRATPHGTVYGIPYRSWQYGKNAILADPAVDDMGMMVCADRDISAVKATNDIGPPGSSRQYDIADGVYLGGMLGTEDPEQYVKFADDGIILHDKNGNDITTSPTGINWTDVNNNVLLSNSTGISINGVVFNQAGQVTGNLPITGNLQLGGSFQALAGSVYGGNITITGFVKGSDFIPTTGVSYKVHGHNYTSPGGPAITGTPV